MYEKSPEYYQGTREEMLDFIPAWAKVILDVGCGTGGFASQLSKRQGVEVWGLEINSLAAQEAERVMTKVLVGDANSLIPLLPDGHFDCIVFNDVLEHLVDPYGVIEAVKEKLAPKGVIVASIPNVRFIHNLFHVLVRKQWKYIESGILDSTHLRFFTYKSIEDMFHEHGYEIVALRGVNPVRSLWFGLFNLCSLGMFADSRYFQFACVATPRMRVEH